MGLTNRFFDQRVDFKVRLLGSGDFEFLEKVGGG